MLLFTSRPNFQSPMPTRAAVVCLTFRGKICVLEHLLENELVGRLIVPRGGLRGGLLVGLLVNDTGYQNTPDGLRAAGASFCI